MVCEYGYEKDTNNCDICKCSETILNMIIVELSVNYVIIFMLVQKLKRLHTVLLVELMIIRHIDYL